MSYMVRDKDNIKSWNVFFSLTTGERVRPQKSWVNKKDAIEEASKLPNGKVSPVYGWKRVETDYPTCPKCGRQGELTGLKEYNYNGGGEECICLNTECGHTWWCA